MACHLLNITPSTAINNEIPFTKLFQKNPSYSHLCVFRCLCYPFIPTSHKLEPRSTPCVFLGYPSQHRGFRCLDLHTRKIIISRHVTFDETSFPFQSMTAENPPSYSFLEDHPSPNTFSAAINPPMEPPSSPPSSPNHHQHTHHLTEYHQ